MIELKWRLILKGLRFHEVHFMQSERLLWVYDRILTRVEEKTGAALIILEPRNTVDPWQITVRGTGPEGVYEHYFCGTLREAVREAAYYCLLNGGFIPSVAAHEREIELKKCEADALRFRLKSNKRHRIDKNI